MISFLKKEDEAKGKFLGKGDLIFLAVIVIVVGGFVLYNRTIKSQSRAKFEACGLLWNASQFDSAAKCYEQAHDLQYLPDSLDAIIYTRTQAVQEMSDRENVLWRKVDSLDTHKDTAAIGVLVKELPAFHFLDSAKIHRLQAWQATTHK